MWLTTYVLHGVGGIVPRQRTETSRMTRAGRIEGNLIEYPLFQFERGKKTVQTFAYEDPQIPGVRRHFTVTNGFGIGGALAQDCLVALMLLREEQQSRDVHFYVKEVARMLYGPHARQKKRYQIRKTLKRLAHTVLEFEDAFFDAQDGEYITTKIKPLFDESTLYQHRRGKNHMDARQENVFRLSAVIENNIAGRYFNYVVFEEYRKLPSGLPRRLFLYLTKKSNGGRRKSFTIGVRKLYDRLPITNKKPSRRFDCLEKTAKALAKIGITHRYKCDTVTFVFPDRVRKSIETAAEGSAPLRDFVLRFYNTLGVETVSERRMTAGLRVLREVGTEAHVDPATLGKIVDWVLERRNTKFTGLHTINILRAVWDQALSDIRKAEKIRERQEAAAQAARAEKEKEEATKRAAAERTATQRLALSEEEAAGLHREAERLLDSDPRYGFTRSMLAENGTVLGHARDDWLRSIEDEILNEGAASGLVASTADAPP